MRKKLFFAGGLLLLVLAGWGFYLYNKPHRSAAGEDADFQLSAADLYGAFQNNEAAANKKFTGRVITVKGLITEIETAAGSTNILMSASATGGISCSFPRNEAPKPEKLHKGDSVVIKGRCSGYLMDVNLVDCALQE